VIVVPIDSISSFADTVDERDMLIRDIYPELQKYCEKTYNISFQVCHIIRILYYL